MTIRNRLSKVVTAEAAARLVEDECVLAVGGAGGVQEPDLLLAALVARFREEGSPRNLTEFHPIRTGEVDGRGTSLFGEPGMVRRMIGGSFWPVGVPRLVQLILDNRIEAYNLPIGIMYAMLDAATAGRPGVLSTVGIGTFVDPAYGGGALNAVSRSPLVERVSIDGEDVLFFRALKPDVAFIRGTTTDPEGNLTMEGEPALCGPLLLAQAAHRHGGKVVAQVKQVVGRGGLDPRDVKVPGIFVDAVVVNPGQQQTTRVDYDPTLVGEATFDLASILPQPLSAAKVVQRRALFECHPGEVVAIGYGLPGHLPAIAVEEGVLDEITFTIEHGAVGGINGYAAGGTTFPVSHNPTAIIDAADQLRGYAGGSVDRAFLGVGEVDAAGNVNVSRFGDRIPGAGGFIEITQGTRRVVFCTVLGDRGRRKFVPKVEQLTFNGPRAAAARQEVLYVTEKAVFELRPEGLVMVELAPGLDARSDVADQLGFHVPIAAHLRTMPEVCWSEGPMGLARDWRS